MKATAHLDSLHVGDIRGALGTIASTDTGARKGLRRRLLTFLAILGPGLIVMAGDNDAGAFSTYTQAGQNYGTSLLWTLLLLVPVLYVNQEMVLRLGAVTGVGHARLILERFGKFWGAFSVIDLFVLNALTIVTEFIGITLALSYFGVPKLAGVAIAAVLVIAGAMQGSFRRFERFALVLCAASLLILPVVFAVHAPLGASLRNFVVPGIPKGELGTVMLLIIGIVGTTVAPWQLFFQQSYVIDKRITPRFIRYGRWDLVVGIVVVVVGGFAMMSLAAGTFAGRAEFGSFADAGAVAAGIAKYAGHATGALFAIALLDASIIGAAAVSLSTAYAIGDVFALKHSLHRGVADAPVFYAIYAGIIVLAAAIVLIPGSPLGLLTMAVQVLAGVLLPSATVFLLLLSNDRAVLGPWANTRRTNVFTAVVVALLVALSIILTLSVVFPSVSPAVLLWVLGIGAGFAVIAGIAMSRGGPIPEHERAMRATWQMPPLDRLAPLALTAQHRLWLGVLRGYLLVAVALVVVRVVTLACIK